ncbi:MAG: glycosyltransferase [Deltaproteobacteria bacterium]|jgi:glycosyltransferase involved in cell wall biosynthesis|nr:glycosyltransferase [Deltaproteobacteria bacterium]
MTTICFCNSNRAWGGGEKWHLETARYFAASGYRVILAANGASPLWQVASKAYLELFDWRPGNLSFLNPYKAATFASFLRRKRVSHLILNLPADLKLAVPAVRIARRAGSDIKIYYRRGSAIPVKPSLLNQRLYSVLTGVIANSEETARCVRSSKVIAADRVHVIYNGLNVEAFDSALCGAASEDAPSASCRVKSFPERFDAHNPLVIGNAGRLSFQKGQKYLLHMSAILQARDFPYRLVICGEGELRQELEELAAGLGLAWTGDWAGWQAGLAGNGVAEAANICLPGFQADLAPFWRSIHLFALSSIWEGFGYVLAEAMLAQRPLLAFNCNSMPELVRDGLNGALIAPPGPGESDAAIGARLADQVEIMAKNPRQLEQYGQAGRAFCLENFDQAVSMEKLKKLLFAS